MTDSQQRPLKSEYHLVQNSVSQAPGKQMPLKSREYLIWPTAKDLLFGKQSESIGADYLSRPPELARLRLPASDRLWSRARLSL
jgi:hypothetical protein